MKGEISSSVIDRFVRLRQFQDFLQRHLPAAGHIPFRAVTKLVTGGSCMFKNGRGNLSADFEHLVRNRADFKLRSRATAEAEEMQELAGIHRHQHARFACIRQDGTGIFLGRSHFHELIVRHPCRLHGIRKLIFLGRISVNRLRRDESRSIFRAVALGTDGKRCDTMARNLCEKAPGNALDAKSERDVFQRRLMVHRHKLVDKCTDSILVIKGLHQRLNVNLVGIAELRGGGDDFLWLWCMCNKCYFQ